MKNAIIVGAGIAGAELLMELEKHKNLKIRVVGLIDDDLEKQGKRIAGMYVLGKKQDLSRIIKQYSVEEVFIAMPSVRGSVVREIIEDCKNLKVSFKVVPRTLDIVQGKVSISNIRDVNAADLIGREILQVEQEPFMEFFKGKTVLITGACGSIGHEICRQLAFFSPKKLIFYDWWENGMFDLNLEFETKFKKIKTRTIVGDIKDKERVENVFEKEKPNIVFHAAAYKHVPLMEDNIAEAVKNNVNGTKIIAETSSKYEVSHFVFISTDKAVNPKSVMGATKLIAEGIIHQLSKNSSTRFISVRFGNVLDSFGSVLPLFRKQITEGGPLTITHKDMKRFFMSIPEAVQLIFQAVLLGKGGEIFVLDMGEQVKIVDLAKLFIRLSGFIPEKDIKIIYTGLRPGEKLDEELFTDKENLVKTQNKKIFITRNFGLNNKNIKNSIAKLLNYAKEANDALIREELARIIPSFVK